jgi:hypothetical protein
MAKPQFLIQKAPIMEYKFYYVILLMVFLIILIPIWMVKYPGMVDYPNHLVRCYILAHYHDSPQWGQRYYLDYVPLPNLAIDLIVTPLLRLFPLIVCGKIFLSLAAALYVVGCSEVGRAVTGKPNWMALVCAFTFYNSELLFGFVNYVFGIGVLLCVFAYWLRVRNAMSPLRFSACCLLSIAAFLVHLSSIAILGVACVTSALLDFARNRAIRGLTVKLIWLVCPLFLMAVFMRKSGRIGSIDWGSPSEKLIGFLAPVRSYSMALDVGVIFALLLCFWVLLKGGKVHSVAAVGLMLFTLFLITPKVLFTSSAADARYVVPGYLFLALSIEPHWGRWQKTAMTVALIAMIVRTGSIAASWVTISYRNEQVLAMGRILPANARIYAMHSASDIEAKQDRGFIHVIQFWTISRKADISTLFALPSQQPLVFRQSPCAGPDWSKCLASYDYVWTYDPPASERRDILRFATPAATWERVTLWHVTRMAVPQVMHNMPMN